AHVVLSEAPERQAVAEAAPQILPLSARSPGSLAAWCQRLAAALSADRPPLQEVALSLRAREPDRCRAAVVARSPEEAAERLLALAAGSGPLLGEDPSGAAQGFVAG